MGALTREIVVQTWFFMGLEDLFFAFKTDSPFKYEPFFCSLGFELICKSYLLGIHDQDYICLDQIEAKIKIDKLAKKYGHKLKKMVTEIDKHLDSKELKNILNSKFDDFLAKDFIDAMEASYLECRYPFPEGFHVNYPIKNSKNLFHDLIASSGMIKFCFAFTLRIIISLKEKFGITIPRKKFLKIVSGKPGKRFCNLFFPDGNLDILE